MNELQKEFRKEIIKDITKELMLTLQQDNDCINRYEEAKFPEEHFNAIYNALDVFMKHYSDFLLYPDDREEIEGYKELQTALDNYFESL